MGIINLEICHHELNLNSWTKFSFISVYFWAFRSFSVFERMAPNVSLIDPLTRAGCFFIEIIK